MLFLEALSIPLLDIERSKAKKRMLAGKIDPSEKFHKGRATEIIGDLIGISYRTVLKGLYIIRSQINRRHATPYHRVENALPLFEIESARARERQRLGGIEKVPQNFGEATETNEIIGNLIGISRETVRKARYIMKYGDEEMKERLKQDYNYRIHNAWSHISQRKKKDEPVPPLPYFV